VHLVQEMGQARGLTGLRGGVTRSATSGSEDSVTQDVAEGT
jgi:hypothetical protein